MRAVTLLTISILGLALGTSFGFAHEKTPGDGKNNPTAACIEMMPGAEEGRKAMMEMMGRMAGGMMGGQGMMSPGPEPRK